MTILSLIGNIISRIFGSILILLIGVTIALFVKKYCRKILAKTGLNEYGAIVGLHLNLEKDLSLVLYYLIYILTLISFLKALGIGSIVMYFVLFIIILTLGLYLASLSKDLPLNLFGRYEMYKNKEIYVGKKIAVKRVSGIIKKIGLFETRVESLQGDLLLVPNYLFVKKRKN